MNYWKMAFLQFMTVPAIAVILWVAIILYHQVVRLVLQGGVCS